MFTELFLKKEGIEKAISKTRESFQTLKLSILEHKKLLTEGVKNLQQKFTQKKIISNSKYGLYGSIKIFYISPL
jgi:hypothetical protein